MFSEDNIVSIKKAIQNNRRLTAVDIQRNKRLNTPNASVRTV